jgi:putative ABC transport system permease protein
MLLTALKFIWYDKPKSIGALAGTLISVFLIGQQSGIFIFLTNGMGTLVHNNSAYIWVVDSKTTNVNALSTIDMRLCREIESIKGVKKAYPLVVTGASAKFNNGKSAGMNIVGSQAPYFVGGPWAMDKGTKEDMLQEGAIITDFFDTKALGDVALGDNFEINNKKMFLAAQTKGVRGFGAVYGFTTIERARYLTKMSPNKASAFLIEKDSTATENEVIERINASITGIKAWKGEDFESATVATVLGSTGIAISIGTLLIFAVISGFVIIGLTLYSSATDRIKDYGTLKAIGATNGYIRRLILTQASVFAVVGFAIGYALMEGFRNGIANAGTIFEYPLWLKISFFFITLIIAFGGSLFAIQKITSVEPAQVFRA